MTVPTRGIGEMVTTMHPSMRLSERVDDVALATDDALQMLGVVGRKLLKSLRPLLEPEDAEELELALALLTESEAAARLHEYAARSRALGHDALDRYQQKLAADKKKEPWIPPRGTTKQAIPRGYVEMDKDGRVWGRAV